MNNSFEIEQPCFRIAMLSIHSSPIGPLGTRDTGGMSVYIRELAKYLGLCGHKVDIFTYARGRDKTLSPNVRLVYLSPRGNQALSKEELPAFLPIIFEALDDYRITHGVNYDLIHSHYWISGVVGAMAQARWRCPHITMFHTLAKVKNNTRSGENEPRLRVAHEQWLAKASNQILVPTARERDNLIQLYHARPDNIRIIPCGVDLDLFSPGDRNSARQKLGLLPDASVILYVGRFAALKGLDQLVNAAAELKKNHSHFQVVLVGGDGPRARATETLDRRVRQLKLAGTVRFEGQIDQSQLPVYYRAADMLVLPSHYESFGLVVLEALACGTPVAATAVGVVPEVIREGFNGSIIASPDYRDVTQTLERLLDPFNNRPKDAAGHWVTPNGWEPSKESIRATVQRFGWQRIAADVMQAYRAVLAVHDPALVPQPHEIFGVLPN